METFEAIMTRRSTRDYSEKPVKGCLLEKVVEAGRYAPSGCNSQTNHFLVITDKEVIRKLAGLVESAFSRMEVREDMYISMKNSIRKAKEGGYVFCYNAPVLVVVANQADYGNNQADVSIAIENMMVAANSMDLGSCYINQLKWLNDDPEITAYLRSLGMKDSEKVYGSMILGYPATEDGLPVRNQLPRTGNEITWIR